MEPLFINKSTYTKQNIMEMSRGSSSNILQIILFICVGLLILLYGLLSKSYMFCILGALFCVFFPFFSLWAIRHSAVNSYQQLLQLYHSETESVTSFYEDHFTIHHVQNGSNISVTYPQVAKVVETKNLYFLMLSTRIGFLLEKQGFDGTSADEFGRFIRIRAVGEGQTDLKKRKRKSALLITAILIAFFAVGLAIGFFGDVIENKIPKTFTYNSYSIKLTSAFDEYDGEWATSDVTVYCFQETSADLSSYGSVFETAAAYLQDTNESYEIYSVVTPVSETCAWTSYTDTYDGNEYNKYDYVVMSNGDFWYTEFYCLAENADKYMPLFVQWAQTIKIDNEMR